MKKYDKIDNFISGEKKSNFEKIKKSRSFYHLKMILKNKFFFWKRP